MNNLNGKLLVCCHQLGEWLSDDVYLPIHCGKALSDSDLAVQGDDTGDNISLKNRNYCELTALYWAWKNLRNADFIGLCHYRRYFSKQDSTWLAKELKCKHTFREIRNEILDAKHILQALEIHDIILPKQRCRPVSLKDDYIYQHIPEDYAILRQTVRDIYPAYLSSFDYVMENTHKLSCYNMFVAEKPLADEYCEWLFRILFEVEKRIKLSAYPYQARVFGFMSERLLNVYCYHHALRVAYKPVLFVTDAPDYSALAYSFRNIRNTVLFKLSELDFRS